MELHFYLILNFKSHVWLIATLLVSTALPDDWHIFVLNR